MVLLSLVKDNSDITAHMQFFLCAVRGNLT